MIIEDIYEKYGLIGGTVFVGASVLASLGPTQIMGLIALPILICKAAKINFNAHHKVEKMRKKLNRKIEANTYEKPEVEIKSVWDLLALSNKDTIDDTKGKLKSAELDLEYLIKFKNDLQGTTKDLKPFITSMKVTNFFLQAMIPLVGLFIALSSNNEKVPTATFIKHDLRKADIDICNMKSKIRKLEEIIKKAPKASKQIEATLTEI